MIAKHSWQLILHCVKLKSHAFIILFVSSVFSFGCCHPPTPHEMSGNNQTIFFFQEARAVTTLQSSIYDSVSLKHMQKHICCVKIGALQLDFGVCILSTAHSYTNGFC